MILNEAQALASETPPLQGHFHPKGKAPSQFTLDVLKQAKTTLPFSDTRDIAEQKRGLIAASASRRRSCSPRTIGRAGVTNEFKKFFAPNAISMRI
jgi:alkyl sulfatase BDS1-like metallo-beta-lactamase superfamily hydrolase